MFQAKQVEWNQQWELFEDNELFLFKDWIYPVKIEDFINMDVLECGCGGGQHTSFIATYAKQITAVDLNTVDIAAKRNKKFSNIAFVEADIESMELGKTFDIVFSIGVVHHTNDPDRTVNNLQKHVKPGGKLILWVYSKEGNALISTIVEPLRKIFFYSLNKNILKFFSKVITLFMYSVVYSLYSLPFHWMPYYEYLQNFKKMSFARNSLNVFDKLNAPQVQLISKERAESWFAGNDFVDINITPYKGVSWRVNATRRIQ